MLPNTPEDIVVQLRMFRSRYPADILWFSLKDRQTNAALWTEYRSESDAVLYRAGNKEKAVKALEISHSKRRSLRGVAAIVDPDFWLIERIQNSLDIDNLLYLTIRRTYEMMMLLNTPALEKVMRHTFVNIATDEIHEVFR